MPTVDVGPRDLLLVIDDGRILEEGKHADLVAEGGMYARLYRGQLLDPEMDSVEMGPVGPDAYE